MIIYDYICDRATFCGDEDEMSLLHTVCHACLLVAATASQISVDVINECTQDAFYVLNLC